MSGLFALPPGTDFAEGVVAGLMERHAGQPPEALAVVTIHANSLRTLSALRAAFRRHGPLLLPRLRLIADLGEGPVDSPLGRRLELGSLIARLIAARPALGQGQAVPALARSLAGVMAEMQSEGCPPDALHRLKTGEHAEHWQLSLEFLRIATEFHLAGPPRDREAVQRAAAEACAADWAAGRNLPPGPVIVAGSTGSHGATRLFMEAVARLPQGAVILPGFDFDQPIAVWDGLNGGGGEDHPQARFAPLVAAFGIPGLWDAAAGESGTGAAASGAGARNRLMSLAMRPAPVTDQWIAEGPGLGDLTPAAAGLTLVEAPDPQAEAEAIAIAIRGAVEDGQPVTLIAADRLLTRRVAAALDRWDLVADDSAGQPLSLTPPGMLLRQVAALIGQPLTLDALLALLKNGVAATGGGAGGEVGDGTGERIGAGSGHGIHLRMTRELELHLRRRGPAFPDGPFLRDWAARRPPEERLWAGWLAALLDRLHAAAHDRAPRPLPDRLAEYRALAEALAGGPALLPDAGRDDHPGAPDAVPGGALTDAQQLPPTQSPAQPSPLRPGQAALAAASAPPSPGDTGALWAGPDGTVARAVMDHLTTEARAHHQMTARDFAALIDTELQAQALRAGGGRAHPLIRIRGPREARTEAVGLVILGGLNEGSWPQPPAPDPWLSRQMRRDAGLTVPERLVGLSAHDFQQAIAAPQVILTRARRNAEAETVPSRWLNRLLNLMAGLPQQNGPAGLEAMRARGRVLVAQAAALAGPAARVPPAPRPSPLPPAPAFRRLSVTQVSTLIRDPYAIYARHVLGLSPLPALRPAPDGSLRGEAFHEIARRFLTPAPPPGTPPAQLEARFMAIAGAVLADEVPWPAARAFWTQRLRQALGALMQDEAQRLAEGRPLVIETEARFAVPGLPLTLVARPDRIDETPDGRLRVFDYKSGAAPSKKQIEAYDKQLPLTAALLMYGAFPVTAARDVDAMAYICLNKDGGTERRDMTSDEIAAVWDRFVALAGLYMIGALGYTARRSMAEFDHGSDYDHLSRHGEWDATTPPLPVRLGGGAAAAEGGQ